MYDDIAWKYFENTGDIAAYIEYRKILENKNLIMDNIRDVDRIEDNKDQRDSN